MKTLWKGHISFGLVNIPVRLYSGAVTHRIDLDMIRREDKCPIEYVRVCKNDGKEVPWDEIAKGYKYEKGDYVVLNNEDFDNAKPGASKEIEILRFVNISDIPSQYLQKPYIVTPDKEIEKSYVLLRSALKDSGKAGLAKFVIRRTEHLGILKTEGDAILLIQIRFKNDLRDPEELDLPDNSLTDKELKMALSIIDEMTGDFNPEDYKDTYKDKLIKLIEDKKSGKSGKKKEKMKDEGGEEDGTDDLLKQLKASLEAIED